MNKSERKSMGKAMDKGVTMHQAMHDAGDTGKRAPMKGGCCK